MKKCFEQSLARSKHHVLPQRVNEIEVMAFQQKVESQGKLEKRPI